MSTFVFYRKMVALNPDVHRNLEFSSNQVDSSFARDTTNALIAGVEFAEPTPSANA